MIVEKNKTYELEILNFGANGEGVGRIENFTIFVENALPSEKILAKIIEVKKTYAVGKIEKILQKSPERVEPFCKNFFMCGGCQLQHLNYSSQLQLKKQKIIDSLERIGKIFDFEIFDTIGMENPKNYRNKMQFPVGKNFVIGCFAKKSHKIIDLDNCLIQRDENNKILRTVKKILKKFPIEPYDEKNFTGNLRHIVGRVGFDNKLMIVFVTATKNFPHEKNIVQEILKNLPEVVSVQQNFQPQKNNVILGQETKILYGEKNISEKLFDLNFKISAKSFFQVNTKQTEILYNIVKNFAELSGNEIVIDAYCGTGTISIFLAKFAKKVFGIEIEKSAIDDAVKNAQENKIFNTKFIVGDALKIIPELFEKKIFADVVVVDPPRSGCDKKILEVFANMNPKKIIYVSCNPATLARDLNFLQNFNYFAKKIQPVDMFPFTSHVESVTQIIKI